MSCRISVIVPVYNMEKTLRRALDSLAVQSYRDYEVIMVDDGSTDGCGAICDDYASAYPNFHVCHKPNGGLSSARNKGMELAEGEWVTFCDSDDYVSSEWLEIFNADNGSGYDLICQGVITDKPVNNRPHNVGKTEYGVDYTGPAAGILDLLYKENILGYTYIKLYRRNIIRSHGLEFNERLYLREDEEFLLRYINHCKSVFSTPKSGYYYFVPDWDRKYGLKFEIEEMRMQSVYQSLRQLMKDSRSKIYDDYFDSVLNIYIREFISNKKNRRYCLSRLRELLLSAEIPSKMFRVTESAIKADGTCIFSRCVLLAHLKIRRFLKADKAESDVYELMN